MPEHSYRTRLAARVLPAFAERCVAFTGTRAPFLSGMSSRQVLYATLALNTFEPGHRTGNG